LFGGAVQVALSEVGAGEVEAGQAEFAEAPFLGGCGLVEADRFAGLVGGLPQPLFPAEPQVGGAGVEELLGGREGEHPSGLVFAVGFLARPRRAAQRVRGLLCSLEAGLGAGFDAGQPYAGGARFGDVLPAGLGEGDGVPGPVVLDE
jgi:hypothetical protein